MLNLNKCTKTKPKPTLIFKNRSCMSVYYCAQPQAGEDHLKWENKYGSLGAMPQWGPRQSLWWGPGSKPPEANDTSFVKICYSVMALRMT